MSEPPARRRARVLWINGAFGAGKTTTARLLAQSLPGSVIFDPEETGSMLRPLLQPVAPVHDFQEWGAWRELVAASINAIVGELPEHGPRLVIVPQTITHEAYWTQINQGLRPEIEVIAVALHVSPDEHRRRVTGDDAERDALRWRLTTFERFRASEWVHTAFTGVETSTLTPAATADALRFILDTA